MSIEFHFVCRHKMNWKQLSKTEFETGEWVVGDESVADAIGGRVYLHETKNAAAWHGGRITAWRYGERPRRKIFTYVLDGDFRISCTEGWGQEKAIVRR